MGQSLENDPAMDSTEAVAFAQETWSPPSLAPLERNRRMADLILAVSSVHDKPVIKPCKAVPVLYTSPERQDIARMKDLCNSCDVLPDCFREATTLGRPRLPQTIQAGLTAGARHRLRTYNGHQLAAAERLATDEKLV